MSAILFTESGHWITQQTLDAYAKFRDKWEKYWFIYWKKEDDEKRKNREKPKLKWAYIYVGRTRIICQIDFDTNKAYKVDRNYVATNMEWKKFTFDRWCTSFDL